ncbi:hypothetical protein H310_14049 [Aphanomyces invadans]|uniref:HD/PDEase domain-containing protein n=1 Tax=Aphanomyces invadans TaxID=157072 RepID=A0A024TB61_9STRA|nr:hypothetical protein H310_14049 [Aphanomyces invadans]ETV91370.1 hypothetical protein H310_14049 [Aphanomyces invadans]|eukprot:XP_008879998.1 hypothetical protein H310_14049 [Aphanomyces invadans]
MPRKVFNDQIHGYITMSPLCVSIIDTPQFQRLRDLKQLGTLYYVFPGASHNRFEHSLGVAHLAGATVERFRTNQPDLDITAKDVELLSVAGLVHDLGHGPFSHVFDGAFMMNARPSSSYSHEDMSLRMLEYLVDDNHIDMDKYDVRFVQQIVQGAKRTHQARLDSRGFLYEIVANGRNCIDVDKFDYLARDMANLFGGKKGYDYSRLWHYNRVIGNEICYHTSVTNDIYEMFQQRYYMHKQIYNHRKGKAVEYMICDAMLLADKELCISDSTESPERFQYMTDHIVKMIECSTSHGLAPARDIIRRIRRRQLYDFVDEFLVPADLTNQIPKVTAVDIACASNAAAINLAVDDIIVYDGRLNYNLQDKNPVDMVSFYSTSDLSRKFHTPKDEVSLLFPDKFEERILRVFSRNSDVGVKQAISDAFRRHLRQYTRKLPFSPASKVGLKPPLPSRPPSSTSRVLELDLDDSTAATKKSKLGS